MDKEMLDILKSMQNDMKLMQSDIKSIKTTQEEHTSLLRALEHKIDVISPEQEKLKHETAEIKGELKNMRKDLAMVEIVAARNMENIANLKVIK